MFIVNRKISNLGGHRCNGKTRQASFPTGIVDPRVEIFLSSLNTNDEVYLSLVLLSGCNVPLKELKPHNVKVPFCRTSFSMGDLGVKVSVCLFVRPSVNIYHGCLVSATPLTVFMPRHQKVAGYYVIPSEILSVRPSPPPFLYRQLLLQF